MSIVESNTMDSRDKKAFEIFLQAIQGVSSEDQLFKLMQRFDAKHKEKMAGRSLDEMLVNAVEHLRKQGQGHKWDRGSEEEQLQSFSKQGFENLLKYMPELKKVWQGHSQDAEIFLPEGSAMATLDVDKVMASSLTDEQKLKMLQDFHSWSGGYLPSEYPWDAEGEDIPGKHFWIDDNSYLADENEEGMEEWFNAIDENDVKELIPLFDKYPKEMKKLYKVSHPEILEKLKNLSGKPMESALSNVDPAVEQYYDENTEILDQGWEEHVATKDWGSGEDRIKITDQMFWEFVEERYYKEQEEMIEVADTEEELDAVAKHLDINFDKANSDIGYDYSPFDVQTEDGEFFGYTEVDNEHEAEKLELEAQKLPEVTETVSYEEDGKWCVGIKGPVH